MAEAGTSARMRLPGVDLARLLPLAAATLLIVVGAFCAWQTWLIANEASAAARVQEAQRQVVQVLGEQVRRDHAELGKALGDPSFLAVLDDHPAAAARLRQLVPDAVDVEIYSGSLDEVLHANYRDFGYGKAAQLMTALSNDDNPLLQSSLQNGERRVSLVERVGAPGLARAHVWIEYSFDQLRTRFESVSAGDGRLELRQGDGRGDLQLLSRGSNAAEREDHGVQIPGSALFVVAAMPRAFIVLPHSWPLALILALLGLAGGGALLWWRMRPQRDTDSLPEEPLLSDVIRNNPEPAKAAAPSRPAIAASVAEPVNIDQSTFRAYDIRGVVGKSLTAGFAKLLGQAIGSVMREKGLSEIVVGRDGRLSGPELAGALSDGLRAAGVDVIDIGAVPTPLVYYAAYKFNTGSGVAVTGSHNPPDYNGFKIVVGGETLSEGAIQDLYHRIVEKRLNSDGGGSLRSQDVVGDYIERITSDVQTGRRLKVVVDCGNGIPGAVAPQVLEGIGCEIIPLYCEVDGTFPNHHPDPSDPHNLEDLIVAVEKTGADLGVAFDGDGDRLGVVTRKGEIIYPDRLLMLFAQDVLSRNPGATIIYDVKCTGHLRPVIQEAAGVPLMWRTGHSLIKAKMRETDAALAGEMSGHFFFKERWFGFDDGIYAAARLLEIVSGDLEERSPEAIFDTLPKGVSTPELKIEMEEGAHYRFMEKFKAQATFGDARLTTIDGVRADWPDGWGLIRPSNTTPVLVLRFDADNEEALERIKQVYREQIHATDASLKLPF
ncbi:MAG TPA: phosphomannomutase/phosphoglucomutase [Luteibacter sp.]|nr:phosphomannomutase/phosphoglucomutase [Luteibacter sp.]